MPDASKVPGGPASHDAFAGCKKFAQSDVFKAELAAINARREVPDNDGASDREPDTRHQLVGLALSGGGIRSASFALGVVQALNEKKTFAQLDYLSTVSGGGYIGSCISAILAQGKELPFAHRTGELEHAAFCHLRNYSNYLAPGKTGRALRIPALMFQGMVRNFLVILPFLLLLVAAVLWGYGDTIRNALESPRTPFEASHYILSVAGLAPLLLWIVVVAPLLLMLSGLWTRSEQASPRKTRDRLLAVTAWLFGLALLLVFINLQPFFVFELTKYRYGLPMATVVSGSALAALASRLAGRVAAAALDRFTDKLLVVGIALLGPLTLWLIALLLTSWAISPPKPLVALYLHDVIDAESGIWLWFRELSGWFGQQAWLPVLKPHDLSSCVPRMAEDQTYVVCRAFTNAAILVFVALAIGLIAAFVLFYDVNAASLHAFYRDRLSAAFLFKPEPVPGSADKLPPYDHLRLSGLAEGRPVHLVNAAINIQNSEERNMRGRNADFFVFSKRHTGGEYTGYCETPVLEQYDHHIDLGAAMAISGAAVSANAGAQVNRAYRFLLMLANVRLGYWLYNPRIAKQPAKWHFHRRPSPYYFFLELFGALNEQRDYVYVTDGGHIENLGVFELLRRRCKYIIVSDASADPKMEFGSLAQLIRLARIDLGVNVDIDLTDLHKAESGLVRAHCALGTIQYGNGQVGQLLYIKSSVSGDENAYVSEYRARHPDFPHEETSDQFFDEAQFEAYRALGHHIASGLFRERDSENAQESGAKLAPAAGFGEHEIAADGTRAADTDVGVWFQELSRWLRPRPADLDEFLEIQQATAQLDRRFADALLTPYFAQIYPEYPGLAPNSAITPEECRRAISLVRDQLYLIERAVLTLRLDDPDVRTLPAYRGLMNMFRRWAQADLFRYGWAVCISDFTPELQGFCHESLDLKRRIVWDEVPASALNAYEQERYVGKIDGANAYYLARLFISSALPPPSHQAGSANPLICFDVAAAFVEGDAAKTRNVVHCLRIRDTYRGQGLTFPLAKALHGELVFDVGGTTVPPLYSLRSENRDLRAAMHLIMRRAGFRQEG